MGVIRRWSLDDRQILFVVVTENSTGLVDGMELRGRNATEDFDVLKIWKQLRRNFRNPWSCFPGLFSVCFHFSRDDIRGKLDYVYFVPVCGMVDDDMPLKKLYQVPGCQQRLVRRCQIRQANRIGG